MPALNGKRFPLYEWSYSSSANATDGYNRLIPTILQDRGLLDSLEIYHSPYLMKGVASAVPRIAKAIKDEEAILIHGDYDVDGIVGSTMLHRFLKSAGAKSVIFLPKRTEHGYGLARDAVEKCISNKISLLITVDCGISDSKTIAYARQNGIDVIITDHHQVPRNMPDTESIVHQALPGESYPFSFLSGAAVVYKLILALHDQLGVPINENEYLPYVALSLITDIMPLVGENRRFVRDGIMALKKGYAPHIEMLARLGGYQLESVGARELGMHVGSRLNAPGRLDSPKLSAQFLLEEDPSRMAKIANDIERLNARRREIQEELAHKALESARKESNLLLHVLHDPEWHEGLLGTAAARVVEELGHPVILLTKSENKLWKGSGRAPEGVDLFSLIATASEYLEHFGGHQGACGLCIDGEKIGSFKKALTDRFMELFPHGIPPVTLEITAKLPFENLDSGFVEKLAVLEPYGKGNPEPLFEFSSIYIENASWVGGKTHLRLSFKRNSGTIDGICFSVKGVEPGEIVGRPVSIAATPKMKDYNGKRSMEFQVRDIKPL